MSLCLKRIVAAKLADGLSPATVRLLMRLESSSYSRVPASASYVKNVKKA